MKKIKAAIVGYGNRGQVYADYSIGKSDELEIAAIVDPNPFKINEAKNRYQIDDNRLFLSLDDFINAHVKCDIVINATMDELHYQSAIKILNAKYNMLIEKPITSSKSELINIKDTAKKNDCQVFVCHVLRYTPFYSTIKKLILDNKIGTIMTMEMNEHVCVPHYLTSYDRGKWNNEKVCGSGFLLAKCCHDMDLIAWLNNKTKPQQVASFAHRNEFIKENAPKGATKYCYMCPHNKTCIYSSDRMYLKFNAMPFLTWQRLDKPLDKISFEEKEKFLKHDVYGMCAYDCGANIVDRQNVIINFSNGSLASFTLTGGTTKADRYIHIVGNRGEIEGKIEENKIILRTYDYETLFGKEEIIDLKDKVINNAKYGGHSGGDYNIMHDLIRYLNGDKSSISITSIDDSINGHLIVYASEKSRKEGKIINIEDY